MASGTAPACQAAQAEAPPRPQCAAHLPGGVDDRGHATVAHLRRALDNIASTPLGLLTGWTLHHLAPAEAKTILGAGFLGGCSTFSTASVEGARLLRPAVPGPPPFTHEEWRS